MWELLLGIILAIVSLGGILLLSIACIKAYSKYDVALILFWGMGITPLCLIGVVSYWALTGQLFQIITS